MLVFPLGSTGEIEDLKIFIYVYSHTLLFFHVILLQEIINNNILLSLTNNDGICILLRLTVGYVKYCVLNQ